LHGHILRETQCELKRYSAFLMGCLA
jgi:hypothetical protein